MKGARSLTSEASSLFFKNGSFKSSNKKMLSSVVPDFPPDTVLLIPLGLGGICVLVCLCVRAKGNPFKHYEDCKEGCLIYMLLI